MTALTTLQAVLMTGPLAARPAASAVGSGTLYSSTDDGKIYQSDGSAWATWATLAGAAGPGAELGYDQITAGVNVTGTAAATPTTIITCAAHSFDGSPVLAKFSSPGLYLGTANNFMTVALWESGSQLGLLAQVGAAASAGGTTLPGVGTLRFSPSAGSHSYLVRAFVSVTTGTPSVAAGSGGTGGASFYPSFIRFTKV